MRHLSRFSAAFTLMIGLGLAPYTTMAQAPAPIPIDPLPPKPMGPVQSGNPTPLPTPHTVPTPTPAPQDPGYAKQQQLLGALKELSNVKNPQEAAAKTDAILAQLGNINVADVLGAIGSITSNANGTDLVNIANILRAHQSGDLGKALIGVYDELSRRRYNMHNLSTDEKNKIAAQMAQLYGFLKDPNLLGNSLNKLKSDLERDLKQAGMDAASAALNGLINGAKDAANLEGLLKGTNFRKLNDTARRTTGCRANPVDDVMRGIMANGGPSANAKMVICD